MRMRSLSLLLLSALCCFPASGFADTSYQINIFPGDFYADATKACTAVTQKVQDKWRLNWDANDGRSKAVFAFSSLQNVGGSPPSYSCLYTVTYTEYGAPVSSVTGAGANATPFAECKAGDTASITWPLGPRDTSFANNVNPAIATVPPFPVCSAGCIVTKVSVDSCYDISDQSPTFVHCDYNVQKTGDTCSSADTPPKPDTTKCPPGTVLSGSDCVTEPPPDPCATDPNATGCLPPLDPCIADPNGAGCSGSGTDPGTGTGTGTGTDPGTGTGNGTGTGTGTDPGTGTGTGEPTHAASGIGCEETFACSGDSITCSIAALNKKQLCEGQKGLDKGSPDAKQAMAEAFEKTHENIEETEIHLDSIIANATNSRFLPSSCPPAQTFTVYGRQFAFKNDYFCNFATAMSWLVVSLAGLFAAVYIGKAFGGS
ncbi:MAG: hypothetical protein ACI9EB_000547 [Pseudomonas sp.]|jgi:hypothetical protein